MTERTKIAATNFMIIPQRAHLQKTQDSWDPELTDYEKRILTEIDCLRPLTLVTCGSGVTAISLWNGQEFI